MGLEDRDWWKEAQKKRADQEDTSGGPGPNAHRASSGLSTGLKWGPAGILAFWLVIVGTLYVAMRHYLEPKPVSVSASGDLVIPRARDGHFYAAGSVNGQPVNFMVDTGASLVTVSEQFARGAGLADGLPTMFKTANGDLPGRIVSGVPIVIGPIAVSGVRTQGPFVERHVHDALLGQSFLSKFEIILNGEQMILRKR